MQHRSWFPAILIGLSLALALVFLGVTKNRNGDTRASVVQSSVNRETQKKEPATEEGYQSAVTSILETYAEEKDAQAAYNALILLRVPVAFQTLHFDLVVAMGKLMVKETADGESRLQALKAQYSWLPL